MTVKFAKNKEDLERILQLRYKILRLPWNQPIETATDNLELKSVNAYIENEALPTVAQGQALRQAGKEIIACGRLQENDGKIGQIRFMAVSDDYQGKGLGKLIVIALEKSAKELHLKTIELQARDNAVDFYKNCGYTIKEKSFLMWDQIQHFLMQKTL